MEKKDNTQEKNESCKGCTYWRRIMGNGANRINACFYLYDTGKIRGSSVESCTRKIVGGITA